MSKEEEREQLNIYNIPANYSDSGRLFGGMVQTRNLIEVLIIVGILSLQEMRSGQLEPLREVRQLSIQTPARYRLKSTHHLKNMI